MNSAPARTCSAVHDREAGKTERVNGGCHSKVERKRHLAYGIGWIRTNSHDWRTVQRRSIIEFEVRSGLFGGGVISGGYWGPCHEFRVVGRGVSRAQQ